MIKIIYTLPIVLLVVLVFHFSIILLSVIPFNPITHKTNNIVYSYIDPLFTQTWTLFAPDPIHTNEALQIQLELANGKTTEWIDATNPLIEKMHANYISPFNRMGRITQSITGQMLTEDVLVNELRNSLEERNDYVTLNELDKNFKKKYELYSNYLLRYASAYAKTIYPEEYVKYITMRIVKQDSIPFSDRKTGKEKEWEIIDILEKKPMVTDVLSLMQVEGIDR